MQAIMRAIALFIVRSMQPLSLVEDEHFRTFIKTIDPRITLPCRSTLTKTILPELYGEAKNKLLVELSQADGIALTTDCWTSSTMASYITVTAHYINDDKVKIISRVLATIMVEGSHTAENLAEIIKGMLTIAGDPYFPNQYKLFLSKRCMCGIHDLYVQDSRSCYGQCCQHTHGH